MKYNLLIKAKETRKEEKGITLIALVITIIVLLILAGVAISMLSGENGILRQAAKSKMQTEEKSNREKIQIAALGAMTNTNHKIDEGTLNEELKKVIGENAEAIHDGRNGWC